jgi:hypothetical protein
MKLRIHADSIRLRLNRAEVARFTSDGGVVTDGVHFGSGVSLSYSIESCAAALATHALFEDGHLRVIVPELAARHWATSDEVGIDAPEARPAVLIEKDFRCMHQDELDPDAYPNPALN